jgi:hypothetical protein
MEPTNPTVWEDVFGLKVLELRKQIFILVKVAVYFYRLLFDNLLRTYRLHFYFTKLCSVLLLGMKMWLVRNSITSI